MGWPVGSSRRETLRTPAAPPCGERCQDPLLGLRYGTRRSPGWTSRSRHRIRRGSSGLSRERRASTPRGSRWRPVLEIRSRRPPSRWSLDPHGARLPSPSRESRLRRAPRVRGTDGAGREILTFIEGDVLARAQDGNQEIQRRGPPGLRLRNACSRRRSYCGNFHDAAATFVPPEGTVWRRYDVPAMSAGEAVCHGDIGPHNTVYRSGVPVAFIDWDTIRPNDPIVEFGAAAWKYVPLGNDVYFEASDFRTRPSLTRRLAVFARAYGVHDRVTVRRALHQAKQRSANSLRYFPITPAQGATELRRVATELEWLDSATGELLAELD